MSKVLFLISFLLLLAISNITYANQSPISKCHSQIVPLHQERDKVSQLDGIWGLFEKNGELQGNSVAAINLDRKINSIIFHLKYLCDTLNGIPMNEVARYVRDGIEKKGENGFRKELIDLGKPETEIDIWFEFTRFSLKNKERSLDLDSIVNSIKRAFPFVYSYVSIAEKIDNKKFDSSIIKNVKKLSSDIDIFFISDKFMNQALTENSNIPYVDINESSGGS
jgi:hypothetical protein